MGSNAEYSISDGNHHFCFHLSGNVARREIYRLISFYNCTFAIISLFSTVQRLPTSKKPKQRLMQPTLNFLKYLLPFSIILYFIQYFIVSSLFPTTDFFYSLWSIYLFMVIATLVDFIILLWVNKNFSEYTGYAFMALGIVKMLAAVIFLIPLIQSDTVNRIPDVALFFIPYFLFLGFETIKAIQLLKK